MQPLILTAAIWAFALVVAFAVAEFRGRRFTLTRDQLAIAIALLGIHSIAERSSAEEVLENPLVLARIARGSLVGIALLLVAPALIRRLQQSKAEVRWQGMGALTVYLGVAAVSVLYTVAPIVSAAKAFELGTGLLIVWAIALHPNRNDELRRNVQFVIFLEAALLLGAIVGFLVGADAFHKLQPFKPGFVFLDTMTSPFTHANALSAIGGLLAAFSLARVLTATERLAKRWWFAAFIVGTLGVVLASGRQGVLIWLAAVGVIVWVHRRRLFVSLIAPTAIAMALLYSDSIVSIFARGRPEQLQTLTGRVNFWASAIDSWSQHLWTGYGFGVGGRFVALAGIGRDTMSHLHSGYMEALSGLGLLGVIPLAYGLFRLAVWSYTRMRLRVDTHLAILIIPLALHTLVANGFAAWLNADFVIFALLVALSDVESSVGAGNELHFAGSPVRGARGRSSTV